MDISSKFKLSVQTWYRAEDWRFAAALLPRLFGTNPRSHHKGATGRVRTGDQRLPVLCHCQLGQDIPTTGYTSSISQKPKRHTYGVWTCIWFIHGTACDNQRYPWYISKYCLYQGYPQYMLKHENLSTGIRFQMHYAICWTHIMKWGFFKLQVLHWQVAACHCCTLALRLEGNIGKSPVNVKFAY